jgi:hypothetical protein
VDDKDASPDAGDLKNKPVRIDSSSNFISAGDDGYIYFMSKGYDEKDNIVKYDIYGKKHWSAHIPLNYKYSKPYIDSKGNIFVLGDSGEDCKKMVRYNPAADKWETLLKGINEGGALNDEEHFAVSNEGVIYVADGYNCLKVFSKDFKRIFITKESKEDDEDLISEAKEEKDDDDL